MSTVIPENCLGLKGPCLHQKPCVQTLAGSTLPPTTICRQTLASSGFLLREAPPLQTPASFTTCAYTSTIQASAIVLALGTGSVAHSCGFWLTGPQPGLLRHHPKAARPQVCSHLLCELRLLLQGQVHKLMPHAAFLLPFRELGLQEQQRSGQATMQEAGEKNRLTVGLRLGIISPPH